MTVDLPCLLILHLWMLIILMTVIGPWLKYSSYKSFQSMFSPVSECEAYPQGTMKEQESGQESAQPTRRAPSEWF